jgi:pimeloyl-ACP methyl ester carboxylesterase
VTDRRAGRRLAATIASIAALLALPGCLTTHSAPNPSFPISRDEAESDFRRMAALPVRLDRPLIVISGIGDPAISGTAILRRIEPVVDGRVIGIDFFSEATFDGARQKLLREAAAQLATDLDHLPEVDVIAFSMGGLVARDAAIPDRAGRRLPIARLFTICTPHEGARLAAIPIGTPQSDDMTPTSDFILRIRAARREYDLICYCRLDDVTVGEEFCAPEGTPLWWVPTPIGEWAHMQAFFDPRIVVDIARRIRGETPFSTLPAAPLPH